MKPSELINELNDITDQLRVHLNASPLDDIVEYAIEQMEDLTNRLMDDYDE